MKTLTFFMFFLLVSGDLLSQNDKKQVVNDKSKLSTNNTTIISSSTNVNAMNEVTLTIAPSKYLDTTIVPSITEIEINTQKSTEDKRKNSIKPKSN